MTRTIVSPADIEAAEHALIQARKTNLEIEVTMPVVYPNGQMVTVVITVQDGDYLVHDAGFGAMFLTSSGARLSAELERRLTDLARHYGCEFINGRMSRNATDTQLALAIVMVANASRTVGDQSIYIRRQQDTEFRQAVSNRIREVVGNRIRENEEVMGKSGRIYHVPNVVLDRDERRMAAFVIALPNRSLVAAHFAEFWDLKHQHASVENDLVYSETGDFRPEDWNLLGEVSVLVPFNALRQNFIARGLASLH